MGIIKKIFSKKVIIPLLIILAIAGGLFYYFRFKSTTSEIKQTFATVSRGEISTSISGTGTLVSSDKSDISARVSGTITKLNFKEGDKVKAGDIIFELDDTDGLSKVRQINDNINQTNITRNNNLASIDKLDMTAPFSGQISNIQVKTGDVSGKNSSILTLTDLSKFKVQIPFNGSALGSISEGQSITLHIADLMQSIKGRINYVNNKAFPSANGGQIFFVEAIIDNPGSLNKGMKASAEVDTSKGKTISTDYGILDYVNNSVLKCDSGGTVTRVNVKDSQFVSAGDTLVEFKNDDLELSRQSNQSKLADLDKQLADANKSLENYKVATPVDGVITKQTLHVGDVVKQGDVVSSVSNNIHMEFSVPFDELDIAKVAVGQKALVTIDALPDTLNRPLTGTVSKIALEGSTSSGVTTYPVTISVESNEKLKLGMNASAQVIVEQKTDTLRLPIQAVQKRGNRSYVMVIGNPTTTTGSGIAGNGRPNFGDQANGSTGSNGTNGSTRRNRGQNGSGQAGTQDGSQDNGRSANVNGGNQYSGGSQGGNNQGASNQNGSSQSGNTQNGNNQNGNGQNSFSRNTQNANGGQGGNNTQSGNNGQSGATGQNRGTGFTGVNNMWAGNTQVQQYYSNAVPKFIEVGISNENYIEVVSGLNEGEQVILPPSIQTTSNTNNNTNQRNQQMGVPGMGAMGGGFGGGGNFGGGTQNRNQSSGTQTRSSSGRN